MKVTLITGGLPRVAIIDSPSIYLMSAVCRICHKCRIFDAHTTLVQLEIVQIYVLALYRVSQNCMRLCTVKVTLITGGMEVARIDSPLYPDVSTAV